MFLCVALLATFAYQTQWTHSLTTCSDESAKLVTSYSIEFPDTDEFYYFYNDTSIFGNGYNNSFPISFSDQSQMIINVSFDYNDDYYKNFWEYYGWFEWTLNENFMYQCMLHV